MNTGILPEALTSSNGRIVVTCSVAGLAAVFLWFGGMMTERGSVVQRVADIERRVTVNENQLETMKAIGERTARIENDVLWIKRTMQRTGQAP